VYVAQRKFNGRGHGGPFTAGESSTNLKKGRPVRGTSVKGGERGTPEEGATYLGGRKRFMAEGCGSAVDDKERIADGVAQRSRSLLGIKAPRERSR